MANEGAAEDDGDGFEVNEDDASDEIDGFVDVAAAASLADEGALLGVRLDGRALVLARAGGELHAVSGVCTHASVLLEEGWVEGTTLRCPLHEAGFDLCTGAVVDPPARAALAVYDVRAEGGRVLVRRCPRLQGPT